jgi:hypothetical protein
LAQILGSDQDLVYKKDWAQKGPDYVKGANWLNYGGEYTQKAKDEVLKQLKDLYGGSAEHSISGGNSLVGQFLNPQNIYSMGMRGETLPTYSSVSIAQARESLGSIARQFGKETADKFSAWIEQQLEAARPGATTMKELPAQQKAIIDALGKPVQMPTNQANWGAINQGALAPQQGPAPIQATPAPQYGGLFALQAGQTLPQAQAPVVTAGLLGQGK